MNNPTLATLPSAFCIRQSRISGAIATAVLLALGATPALGATYSGSSSAGSGTIHVPGPSNYDSFSGAAPDTASSSSSILIGAIGASTNYMYADSTSAGSASTGAAHAMSIASAQANLLPGQGSANAQSSTSATGAFSDVFELNASGYAPGTMVAMTFAIDVTGVFGGGGSALGASTLNAASWSGTAWWRATTQLDGYGFEQSQQLYRDSTGANDITGSNMNMATYTVNVYLGSHSVTLRAETYATASAGVFTHGSDPGSAWAESAMISDLGNTVGWGGILGLSTLDGTAITDFTAISSTSGFNYANAYSAVPVPPAVWLFGSGLLGLFGVMRRKITPA